MFYVGQKVVCVTGYERWCKSKPQCAWPHKGEVYTIRELLTEGSEPSLRLVEIRNPPLIYTNVFPPEREPAFVRRAFRPIVERKTSIEIFQRMLTDNREHV